jgi:hypothetical protein
LIFFVNGLYDFLKNKMLFLKQIKQAKKKRNYVGVVDGEGVRRFFWWWYGGATRGGKIKKKGPRTPRFFLDLFFYCACFSV